MLLKRGGKIYRPPLIPKEGQGIVVEVELKIENSKEMFLKCFITVLEICMKILILLVNTQFMTRKL